MTNNYDNHDDSQSIEFGDMSRGEYLETARNANYGLTLAIAAGYISEIIDSWRMRQIAVMQALVGGVHPEDISYSAGLTLDEIERIAAAGWPPDIWA